MQRRQQIRKLQPAERGAAAVVLGGVQQAEPLGLLALPRAPVRHRARTLQLRPEALPVAVAVLDAVQVVAPPVQPVVLRSPPVLVQRQARTPQ